MVSALPLLSASLALAAGEPCKATTALEGPVDLVAPIQRELEQHGVPVGRPGTCHDRSVRARVANGPTRGSFRLHIEDGFGRTSDRVLNDSGTAASLVESWAIEEDADLLTLGPPSSVVASSAGLSSSGAPAAAPAFHLYGGIGSLVGSDHSVWATAVFGGCGRLGAACVGAEISGGSDLGLGGESTDVGMRRSSADVIATGSLPLTSGRWLLMPSVGVGVGWIRSHVAAEGADGPPETGNSVGVRGLVSVLAGAALSKHVGIALDIGATYAPSARPAPGDNSNSNLPAEPRWGGRGLIACTVVP